MVPTLPNVVKTKWLSDRRKDLVLQSDLGEAIGMQVRWCTTFFQKELEQQLNGKGTEKGGCDRRSGGFNRRNGNSKTLRHRLRLPSHAIEIRNQCNRFKTNSPGTGHFLWK